MWNHSCDYSLLLRLVKMESWKAHIYMKEGSTEISTQQQHQQTFWFPKEKNIIFLFQLVIKSLSDKSVPIKILSPNQEISVSIIFSTSKELNFYSSRIQIVFICIFISYAANENFSILGIFLTQEVETFRDRDRESTRVSSWFVEFCIIRAWGHCNESIGKISTLPLGKQVLPLVTRQVSCTACIALAWGFVSSHMISFRPIPWLSFLTTQL